VNIYRREENVPFWTKINTEPLKLGNYQVPADAFIQDTTLQAYIDMAKGTKQADVKDMAKVFFLLKRYTAMSFHAL
jgi:hypothetical protein